MLDGFSGSSVISHMDSNDKPENINVVTFVDGTGGVDGGGLAFWKDNEFKEKIFEATNVRNTCVLYDMSARFYHGFKPMPAGSYRWSINATYAPSGA